jgi:hypothetical protein
LRGFHPIYVDLRLRAQPFVARGRDRQGVRHAALRESQWIRIHDRFLFVD